MVEGGIGHRRTTVMHNYFRGKVTKRDVPASFGTVPRKADVLSFRLPYFTEKGWSIGEFFGCFSWADGSKFSNFFHPFFDERQFAQFSGRCSDQPEAVAFAAV